MVLSVINGTIAQVEHELSKLASEIDGLESRIGEDRQKIDPVWTQLQALSVVNSVELILSPEPSKFTKMQFDHPRGYPVVTLYGDDGRYVSSVSGSMDEAMRLVTSIETAIKDLNYASGRLEDRNQKKNALAERLASLRDFQKKLASTS